MPASTTPGRRVVVGILIDGDRVLLGLRSASRRACPSAWALPGGHLEPGESEPGALRRELREELGIEVPRCADEPASRLQLRGGPDDEVVILSAWPVLSWRGDPTNLRGDEHDRLSWFGARQVAGLRWAHPQHLELVLSLLHRIPGG